jgi:hypothetical protein
MLDRHNGKSQLSPVEVCHKSSSSPSTFVCTLDFIVRIKIQVVSHPLRGKKNRSQTEINFPQSAERRQECLQVLAGRVTTAYIWN